MLNKWDFSGVDQVCFSDQKQESYIKAAEFLGDTVEDWGGGTGWAKQYFRNYKNIDGSRSKYIDVHADLAEYTSDCDNILMRQVLETNHEWKQILENVKQSFRKRFCLVMITPFSEETRVYETEPVRLADGTTREGEFIDMISFKKEDILSLFPAREYAVREETIKTNQGYGEEWCLYVEKL